MTRRYYSCVLCSLKYWENYNKKDKTLSFYIKPYPKGKVSTCITTLPIGSKLILKGPMSPGLMLNTTKPGLYVACSGGTGILPFMDLVYYI